MSYSFFQLNHFSDRYSVYDLILVYSSLLSTRGKMVIHSFILSLNHFSDTYSVYDLILVYSSLLSTSGKMVRHSFILSLNHFSNRYSARDPILVYSSLLSTSGRRQCKVNFGAGLNPEFYFSSTGCFTKIKESTLHYHLAIAGGRRTRDAFVIA